MNKPYSFTNFTGEGPMGLWDPAKATSDFRGGLHMVGGSLPEEGHSPFDDHPGPGTELSANDIFGLPTFGSSMPPPV